MVPRDQIPVVVITGFQGAGKTTFINRILANPAFADTAVVVNEFGTVDVDGDLVRTAAGDLLATSSGCLCCTVSADIRATLFDLLQTARARLSRTFSRVIVETTGLADPAAVINALTAGALPAIGLRDHTVARCFRLAAVLTLVDAVTGDLALDCHLEAVKQVAFADAVLVTKTDLLEDPASRRDLDALVHRITALAPTASVATDPQGLDGASLFDRHYAPDRLGGDAEGWLAIDRLTRHSPAPGARLADRHADDISAVVLSSLRPISLGTLDVYLTLLQNTAGAEVLRVKGLVALQDDPERPAVVHMVRHVIHPPVRLVDWPSDDRSTRLVVIGRGLDPGRLRTVFDALVAPAGNPGQRKRNRAAAYLAGTVAGIVAAALFDPLTPPAAEPTPSQETKP